MTKRTLEDKVKFNEKKHSEFSEGYLTSVTIYKSYSKMNIDGKRVAEKFFDNARIGLKIAEQRLKTAQSDIAKDMAKNSVNYYKGIFCGLRDASKERKSNKNHFS